MFKIIVKAKDDHDPTVILVSTYLSDAPSVVLRGRTVLEFTTITIVQSLAITLA